MKVKKDIFLKALSTILFWRFNGKFTKKNTIIVNNSPVKHILNNFENVLLLVSWLHDGASPYNMFVVNMLLLWLQNYIEVKI